MSWGKAALDEVVIREQGSIGRKMVRSSDKNRKGKRLGHGLIGDGGRFRAMRGLARAKEVANSGVVMWNSAGEGVRHYGDG